jgi:LPXTG-site transpeptidase (sortase) family protein
MHRVGSPVLAFAANTLMSLGVLIIGIAAGIISYSAWLEWRHDLTAPTEPPPVRVLTPVPMQTAPAQSEPAQAATIQEQEPTLPEEAQTPASVARPTEDEASDPAAGVEDADAELAPAPTLDPGSPIWMRIPRIGVNTSVMEVGPMNGFYEVPAWDIGHHQDSAPPGLPGNSVFTGHVETIDAGRVFARLSLLEAGDRITVLTASQQTDWEVIDKVAVPIIEHGYIYSAGDTRITLYTCTGTFDPRTRDYSHRLVITGRLLQTNPRE